MSPNFTLIRCKFGSAFFKVRCAINKKQIDLDAMKGLLADCFPFQKSEFTSKDLINIDAVLDVVKGKCNLIDINCLEVVVEQFDVLDAVPHIEKYKSEVEEFCQTLHTELSLDETLEVVRSPQRLSHETVIFILERLPQNCTVGDIRDIVAKSSGASSVDVQIHRIKDDHSISVTCFVPMSLTGFIITTVFHNIEELQSNGLKQLIVADEIVWDVDKNKVSNY